MEEKHVSTIEAIQAFYIAEELLGNVIRSSKKDEDKLRKKLQQTLKKVHGMDIRKIMTQALMSYGPRFDNYFNSTWTLKRIPLAECGVWPRMSGLPSAATYGNVLDTAEYIKPYIVGKRKSKLDLKKIRRAVRLGNLNEVINEYVPIIVYEDGIIRHNKMIPASKRKPFKRCNYDIDDGNHRAISLALEGKKDVLALVGKRISKSDLLYF